MKNYVHLNKDGTKNGGANKFDVYLKTSSPKYLPACMLPTYMCVYVCIDISIHN